MKKYHRKSIRLKGYDYSQSGAYFVTISAYKNQCRFGKIVDDEMQINKAGRIVQKCWNALPSRFEGIALDEFVIMPNHIHGIIFLVGAGIGLPVDSAVGVGLALPSSQSAIAGGAAYSAEVASATKAGSPAPTNQMPGGTSTNPTPTLGNIIGAFKSVSTLNVNRMFALNRKPLWHRNYYEHIIRDEESLNRIREYIIHNPLNWSIDRENPDRKAEDPFDKWIESFRALRDKVQKQNAAIRI